MNDDCLSVLVKLLKAWNGHRKPADTKNPNSNIFHSSHYAPYKDGLLNRINEQKWGPKYVFRTIYRQCDTIIKALNSRPKLIPLHLLINRQRVQDINLLTGVGNIDGDLDTFYTNVRELFFVTPPAQGEDFPDYDPERSALFADINNFLRSIFNLQLNFKPQEDKFNSKGPIGGVAGATMGGTKKGEKSSGSESLKSDSDVVVEDEEIGEDEKALMVDLIQQFDGELGQGWSGFMITHDTLKEISDENVMNIQDIKAGEIEDLKKVDDKLQGEAKKYTDYTSEQIKENEGESIAESTSSTIDNYLRRVIGGEERPITAEDLAGPTVDMMNVGTPQSPTSNNPYTDLPGQVWLELGQQFRDYLANNFKGGQTETSSQEETMDVVEEITPLSTLRDDLFWRVPRKTGSGYVNNASDRKLYRILARQNRMAGEERYGSDENRPREAKLPDHVLRRDQWARLRRSFSRDTPIEDRLIEFGMTNKEPGLINQLSRYIQKEFGSTVSDEDIIRYILDPPELKEGYNARQNVISLSRDFRDFLRRKGYGYIIDEVKRGNEPKGARPSPPSGRGNLTTEPSPIFNDKGNMRPSIINRRRIKRSLISENPENSKKTKKSENPENSKKTKNIDDEGIEVATCIYPGCDNRADPYFGGFCGDPHLPPPPPGSDQRQKMNVDGVIYGGKKKKRKKSTKKRRRKKKKTRKSKRKKKRTKKKKRRRKKRTRRRR